MFGVIKRSAPSLGVEVGPIEMRDADEIEQSRPLPPDPMEVLS
jgi:hypothetical protein